MYDIVLACCRWLEDTPWGATIRASSWMFPVLLWVHLVGLCIWFGTGLAVDLRLMGVGARRQTAVELSDGFFAWNWLGFAVAFVGGFLLLSAEATTYVTNAGFWLKLAVLFPPALICHVVVQRNAAAWADAGGKASAVGRFVGALELMLWISVVAAAVVFLLTNAVTHA
jgi:hypothetical protein